MRWSAWPGCTAVISHWPAYRLPTVCLSCLARCCWVISVHGLQSHVISGSWRRSRIFFARIDLAVFKGTCLSVSGQFSQCQWHEYVSGRFFRMTNSLQPAYALVPGANLEAYVHTVNSIPLLTPEQERELAESLYYEQDIEAARQMVLAHLRFVVHIARSYSGYGLAQADLIQEGNVGLMKAVKRFNPEMGVRLVSFAVHWIKAEIHEFILRNWRIVKVATTKAQRKLFFNLRSQKKRLAWLNNDK